MELFGTDKREAFVAAAVAWYSDNHGGQASYSYADLNRAQRLARQLGIDDYIEPRELDTGAYHWMAADYYRALRKEHGPKGCTDCACRDCPQVAFDGEVCGECAESGCCDLGGADCECPDTEPDSDTLDKGYDCEFML